MTPRNPWTALGAALCVLAQSQCSCRGDDDDATAPAGDGYAAVFSVDATTVIVSFSRKVDAGSVSRSAVEVWDRTVVPARELAVQEARASGAAEVTLRTSPQELGRTYTLTLRGVKDSSGHALDGSLNFLGGGSAQRTRVSFRVDDAEGMRAWGNLRLQVTLDPSTGRFAERFYDVELGREGSSLAALIDVEATPLRTVDRQDDTDTVTDRRAYAARVIATDKGGVPASALQPFEVPTLEPVTLVLALLAPTTTATAGAERFDPPADGSPGDGKAVIRLIVDDRRSRELANPALLLSFDADGNFDANLPLQPGLQSSGVAYLYETTVSVKVDPGRTDTSGQNPDTMPYLAILVNDGTPVDAINAYIVAADETPQAVVVPLGKPGWAPVTFRVDISRAYLKPDGSLRGKYGSEAIFLTGQFNTGVDAFGRNATDAWSGGAQVNLRMLEDAEHPGVWFKTLWMAPWTYAWKVLRCPKDAGCAELNRHVQSSGQAFATVMKNLVTSNDNDGVVVDPVSPAPVSVGGATLDYSNASVYSGTSTGPEPNPPWAPRADTLFKHEAENLAATVTDRPVATPVYVVGTWRDINFPKTPAEIQASTDTFQLGPYDYDDGLNTTYPPYRSDP